MNKIIWKVALGMCITMPSLADMPQKELGYELEYAHAEAKQNPEVIQGSIASVGSGAACNYRIGDTKIQDAIDDGNLVIRIVEETYNENLFIDDQDVNLIGGYPTCDDANNDTNRNFNSYSATISPVDASGLPVIRITGSGSRNTVNIENLTITNGEDAFPYASGGISVLSADLTLNLKQLDISYNEGNFGGGIAIVTGDTDAYFEDVYVRFNTAETHGGGLYCTGSNNSVLINSSYDGSFLDERSGFYSNTAEKSGGGAYINTGCAFTSYVGSLSTGFISRGFRDNEAKEHGGGLAVVAGSSANLRGNSFCNFIFPFTCYGNQAEPNSFRTNVADLDDDGTGDGGAIYVTGSGSILTATNQLIENNQAAKGAGVALADNATMTTNTSFFTSVLFSSSYCWSNDGCNQYLGNLASKGNQYGGAFYVSGGASLEANQTIMRNNSANFGSGVYVIDQNSAVLMEGNLIANNGDSSDADYLDYYPIRVASEGSFEGHYITVADNNANVASIGNSSGSVLLRSSIVHDSNGANGYAVSNAVSSSIHCVMSNEADSFNGINMAEDDPVFVDRANGDFHIDAAFSPAVDYCHSAFTDENFNDIDEDSRGWDDYIATNTYGPFDIGYDETYENDVIFKHNIED